MRWFRTAKRILGGLILWFGIAGVIIGLAHFAEWQYVLANQWIKLPATHYEWWEFIFAWDQAWAWLWYVNFPLWLLPVSIVALVIGCLVSVLILGE